MILIFFLGLIIFLVIATVIILAHPILMRGGPYVTSSHARVARAVTLAGIKKGDQIVDLGSGDGRLLIAVAKSGALATGYETNPLPLWHSYRNVRAAREESHIQVRRQNLWHADLSETDVVFFYLLPGLLRDLEKKLERELRPGARVVSLAFPLPTWRPKKVEEKVYYYEKPEKDDNTEEQLPVSVERKESHDRENHR